MIEFSKWQGCGNDFVVIDCLKSNPVADRSAFAQKFCDRHYGIGADGILFIDPSNAADFRMRIFNADGSEAEMCGNGIRCVARYLFESQKVSDFKIETGAGILIPKINSDSTVTVDMGEPILEGDRIPVNGFGANRVISEEIEVLGEKFKMTCVSMGNPHCVVFVDDAENFPVEKFGTHFEHHQNFPRKINTEFVEIINRQKIRMRVWERGASITLACGTGACATLVASVLNDRSERESEIVLDGGILRVLWDSKSNHVFMTGSAEKVFEGSLKI